MEGLRAEGVRMQLEVRSALKLQRTRTLVLSISPLSALAHKYQHHAVNRVRVHA